MVVHISMVASASNLLEAAGTIAGAILALSVVAVSPSGADEFVPLCADVEPPHRHCWNPVEVADHEGCHFFGHVSYFEHAPPMRWSGVCRNGKAIGHGILFDDWGNRAEGLLLNGRKDGPWKVTLTSVRGVIMESHAEGVYHGPWIFDLLGGLFYAVHYEDGRMHGPWEHRDGDGYSEIGTLEDETRNGTWTITWPDGVEALVPYENGVIHGEMTVTRDGRPLGTLIYWKGKHVDGILYPVLVFPDDP